MTEASRPQRTDTDSAIEHGGYLADAVERYLKARNIFDEKESTSGCDVRDSDSLNDHRRSLINAIGEFRKRARRYDKFSKPGESQCLCATNPHTCPQHGLTTEEQEINALSPGTIRTPRQPLTPPQAAKLIISSAFEHWGPDANSWDEWSAKVESIIERVVVVLRT